MAQIKYVGETIGELHILEEYEPHITPNGSKQRRFKVQCSCGSICDMRLESIKRNKMCTACSWKQKRSDLTGQRFGMLVVISMAADYISPSGHRLSRCNCVCDCGKKVVINMSSLVTGASKSCGCQINTSGLLKDNKELMSRYDYERNKELQLDLENITARSNVKVWWKCDKCGNSWLAQVASQNDKNKKHGCPYCAGTLVIKGKTDLQSRFPDIAKEWDFEKNSIMSNEISAFSGKKVWWICKEGHEWKSTVANRVNGNGCPRCNIEKVNSFCEQAVYYYIKQAFPDAINSDTHIGMELDIFIPSKNVAIEYDGEAWHKSTKKIEIDIKKNELCKTYGITLIRVREPKLVPIEGCISFVRTNSTTNDTLDHVICDVLHYLKIYDVQVNTTSDTPKILEQFATKKYENSLANIYPELVKEWHPIKNGSLTPDKVNKASRYKVWWICPKGHEYQMTISNRTRIEKVQTNGKKVKAQGCPYCAGKKILIGYNDMQSLYPEVAKEWHSVKNGNLMPSMVTPGSSKKVWWKCDKCGYEWQSAVEHRCLSHHGCPNCSSKKRSPEVICIETGTVYTNGKEAAVAIGLPQTYSSTIYKCCRGEAKMAGGYHWKYAKE